MGKVVMAALLAVTMASGTALAQEAQTGTAEVNGMKMYYEVSGDGAPVVLLHGAYMSIDSNWRGVIPTLAADHKVIALELQGHGRSTDADRPISYESMADDVATLLEQLGVTKASLFGYSMGGGVALQFAIRHPEMTDRLVVASASYSSKGLPEGFEKLMETITPEMMAATPYAEEYKRLAPNPENFPALVEKLKQLDLTAFDWQADYEKITAPTLLIFGDADIITHAHQTEMYRLLGGTENGDMNGIGKVQMLVLPGTSHTSVFLKPANVAIMNAVVPEFLAAELPAKTGM